MDNDICWYDEVGDRWESEGTDPGRIFEFHQDLAPDLQAGRMVETTTEVIPGNLPETPLAIKRVLVRHQGGEEIEMPGNWVLVVTRGHRLVRYLC